MGVLQTLLLKFGVDTSALKTGLAEVEGSTTKSTKGFSVLKGAMAGIGTSAIVSGLGGITRAAADEEANIALLDNALQNAGTSYDEVGDKTEGYIAGLGKQGIADDKARDALATLTASTGSYDKAMALMPQTMDLARAKHMDFNSAAALVGKVANGNVGILKRYGVTVGENATAEEALAAMQGKFAGASESYGNTSRGQMDAWGVSLGNVKEDLGGMLGPMVPFLAMAPQMSMQFASMAGAAGGVGPLLAGMKGGFSGIGKAMMGAIPGVSGLNIAMGPMLIIVIAIAAAVAIFYLAWTNNWGDIQGKFAAVWAVLGPILSQLQDWLGVQLTNALTFLGGVWTNTLLPAITSVWNFLNTYILPILSGIVGIYIAALQLALTALAGFWENVLLPAITAVWNFLNTYILPILSSLVSVEIAALKLALTALGALWDKILLPAIKLVWSFLQDNIFPIFKTLGEWLGDKLQGPLKALKDLFAGMGAPGGALSTLKNALQWIIDRLADLKGALDNMKLPDWLTPGSPTPLEMGIRGIGAAAKAVGPLLESSLGKVAEVNLGKVADVSGKSAQGESLNVEVVAMLKDIKNELKGIRQATAVRSAYL